MSIYLYAPTIYPGTRELIEALQAKRLVKHDGMRFLHKGVPVEFNKQDTIVCWGRHIPPVPGIRCLNTSYEYQDSLGINVRGLAKLSTQGYRIFTINYIGPKRYKEAMAKMPVDRWWPTKAIGAFVPIPEFEDYANEHFNFEKLRKVVFFNSKIVNGQSADDMLITTVKLLGFDFGVAYVGSYKGADYMLRFFTAPTLDASDVKLFAKLIGDWAGE